MSLPLKFYYSNTESGIYIIHGDSIKILPELKHSFPTGFDACITDPPYNINYRSNYTKKESIMGKVIANDDSFDVIEKTAANIFDNLKDNTAAYFFASPDKLGEVRTIFDPFGHYKNTLVFDKGDQGTMGDLISGYCKNWEAILYYNKGKRKLNPPRPRSVYRWNWAAKNDPVHPNSKPLSIFIWLLRNSTSEGDFILDPFMGSGPLALACKQLGRRYLGIELDKTYCNRAVERLHV